MEIADKSQLHAITSGILKAQGDIELAREFICEHCDIDDELLVIRYFLSHVIERKIRDGYCLENLLKSWSEISSIVFTSYFDFDVEFSDFLMSHCRTSMLTLEEELLQMVGKYVNHDYS